MSEYALWVIDRFIGNLAIDGDGIDVVAKRLVLKAVRDAIAEERDKPHRGNEGTRILAWLERLGAPLTPLWPGGAQELTDYGRGVNTLYTQLKAAIENGQWPCPLRRSDGRRCLLVAEHKGEHDAGDSKWQTMRQDGL